MSASAKVRCRRGGDGACRGDEAVGVADGMQRGPGSRWRAIWSEVANGLIDLTMPEWRAPARRPLPASVRWTDVKKHASVKALDLSLERKGHPCPLSTERGASLSSASAPTWSSVALRTA